MRVLSSVAGFAYREAEVSLLRIRGGVPSWGPQLLARHAQVDLVDTLPDLFRDWDRWSAEVSESHTNHPGLIHFRSPSWERNWLISLLAVLDAAALHLAFNPHGPADPDARDPARGLQLPARPGPRGGHRLRPGLPHRRGARALVRTRRRGGGPVEVPTPVDRKPPDGWPDGRSTVSRAARTPSPGGRGPPGPPPR
ncbi:hypothetical protein ACODT5_21075 [Streptomyces sp. 5.8]|uniref:hypothetical protein n=1 Tax=Streptomyces sp. 5.8 TaxID=3406571 RepID=UPI003BB813C2